MIEGQADHVTGMLTDMARGLPSDVVQMLSAMSADHMREVTTQQGP